MSPKMEFSLGTKVEVTSYTTEFRDSWYKATISQQPKPRTKSLWVEFETLFDTEDPSKKLQEFNDSSLIRPLPPTHSEEGNKFEKFDFVEVYCKGGWYTGVLLHVFGNGFKYLVAFLDPYEEFLYGKDDIRVHLKWLGGCKWKKVCLVKKDVTFCPPKVGENVVASLPESTLGAVSSEEQASSPANKVKRTASGDAVGRPSSDPNFVVQSVDAPPKFPLPCTLPRSKRNTHSLIPKKNVTFCPPKVGEVVVASLLESTLGVASSEEQASSPAKKVKRTASADAVGRPSSDPNFVVQSVDALPKFLQPCSLPPRIGDTHSNGKSKASDGQNYSPLSLIPEKVSLT